MGWRSAMPQLAYVPVAKPDDEVRDNNAEDVDRTLNVEKENAEADRAAAESAAKEKEKEGAAGGK